MNARQFLEAMNEVSDKYYEEAGREFANAKTKYSWGKWIAVAACLCCAVVGTLYAVRFSSPISTATGNDTAVEESLAYGLMLDSGDNIVYFPISFEERIRYELVDEDAVGLTPENAYRITQDDIGEYMGTVKVCEDAEMMGCSAYHFTKFPNYDSICIVEQENGYAFYTAEWLDASDGIGQLSDAVLDAYGIPESIEKLEISSADETPLFEVEDNITISSMVELLSGKENSGLEANERRFAKAWYDAYGNEDVYFSEEDGCCAFKSSRSGSTEGETTTYVDEEGNTVVMQNSSSAVDGSLYEKAHDLWGKGERIIKITTDKGFVLSIDYFPSIRTASFGNGYYELTGQEAQELNAILKIDE